MLFKTIASLSVLFLSAVVSAAPVPEVSDRTLLYGRTLHVHVRPSSNGDFQNLVGGRTEPPRAPPHDASKSELKQHAARMAKWRKKEAQHDHFDYTVAPTIHDAIHHASKNGLHLDGHPPVDVKVHADAISNFHHNAAHDHLPHYTFSFNHENCGGKCIGHAYAPGAGAVATIWDQNHNRIFHG
ncbi:hypothetical protein CVT26_004317 [Gymnopilus dilepis]|uniref:SCP domain-containing protein n=1 Tax=Gymnopilus dilepis TaxID=231916 RepID=A0A409W2A6_9AGAR|nr:hypothetical protein CVT26_004317 [Gymnopilus dilepis]